MPNAKSNIHQFFSFDFQHILLYNQIESLIQKSYTTRLESGAKVSKNDSQKIDGALGNRLILIVGHEKSNYV